jgi:hypothetical protein
MFDTKKNIVGDFYDVLWDSNHTKFVFIMTASFCKERRFCPIKLVKYCRSLLKYPYQARIVSGLIFVSTLLPQLLLYHHVIKSILFEYVQ